MALLDGSGLPQAKSLAQEPSADDPHPREKDPVRGSPRGGRRGRGAWGHQAHQGAALGDRIWRRDQLTHAVDELRGWAGRRAESRWYRATSRSSRRGQEPAGSRAGQIYVPHAAAGDAQRDSHLAATAGAYGVRVADIIFGPACGRRDRSDAVCQIESIGAGTRPAVPVHELFDGASHAWARPLAWLRLQFLRLPAQEPRRDQARRRDGALRPTHLRQLL